MKKTAKKSLVLAACLGIIGFQSFGQNSAKPFALGVNLGVMEYAGDVSHNFYTFQNASPSFGVSLDHYLNKSFNTQIALSFGKFAGENDHPINSFETKFMDFGVNVKYKLNNGYLLKEDSKVAPFLIAGIGFLDYKAENTSGLLKNPGDILPDATKEAAFRYPIGYGVAYALNNTFSVQFQSSWAKPASDEIDNWNASHPKGSSDKNDRILHHQLGVTYTFGGEDSDNDGVADKHDRCPELAGPASSFGCPDADNDGVLDSEDKCPNIKGVVFGCPDSDGDGFIDSEDKCPDVAGSLNGCLDSDQDGIADSDDQCPEVKGCINGCPDSDGDGVIDSKDKCPNEAGDKSNEGCPLVVEEVEEAAAGSKDVLAIPAGTRVEQELAHQSTTIRTIYFDYNSAVINPEIQGELDEIATILNKNKEYYVILEGHTDNSGSDKYNEWLAGRRVDKVSEFLVSKGISKSNILFVKYGESKPLLPNDTETGMGKNRRVVMKVVKN